MRPLPLVIATALLILFTACKGSPTEPHGMAQVIVNCDPNGPNVTCRATGYNVGDVPSGDFTNQATWLSDGAPGSFPQPGVFVPSARGEVRIWARVEGIEEQYPKWFLVDPSAAAQALYWISGTVKDAETNQPISGATVRVLDGYAAGKSAVTSSLGAYTIRPALPGETVTVEASREGYATTRLTYLVQAPVNNYTFADIKLQRLP